ncbi:MFS transporter [Rhodocytophaga rosea]|uniref:MFS transporter n=1 Tax=Rhodocytophaga rosea TaxID=2704465 RepID=A0A6C0GSZ9_9BACT|nr:MFS transporter [Rhodocytophaga rosea]QHT70673.1 MFS transporter [Rhodocytophaga rosea]
MKNTKTIFFAACLGMLLFGIGLITLGSVATGLQAKFSLDAIASGAMFSILPVGILAGSLLFGPFCDRFGYKYFLLLSCLCMFAGFQGIAYASSLGILKVCIFLFGFGGGSINGATNAVVSDISSANKGANLSLLGVFFAIGALGMPFILGTLGKQYSFEAILATVGYLTLLIGLFFVFTTFPEPKQKEGIPFLKGLQLLKDPLLILIGFFLFCQSSFEGIINNWTTTYLSNELSVFQSKALYALSLYVVGMAVMRILIGSVFRSFSSQTILFLSFALLLAGCVLLQVASSYYIAVSGLILIGAGLAAGFPVMLGFVGERYKTLSGTAFSLVLAMSLIGNMIVNYLMGVIAEAFGIAHLTSVVFTLLALMILLSLRILKKINFQHL